MGAGASVSPREWADPELKGLIDTVASLSNDVNIHHRNLLEKELSKSFKQHEKIIKIITSKTKRKLDHMMSTTAFSLQDLYTLVGNKDYGNFMTRLCTPGPVLMKLDLENAVAGLGADLNTIAFALCTADHLEVKALVEHCFSSDFDLEVMLHNKIPKAGPKALFKGIISETARSHDDVSAVPSDVKILGETDVLSDDLEIVGSFFNLITRCSFAQLDRIDAYLQENSQMTLDQMIDEKFPRKQMSNYLKMWVRRPPAAFSYLLSLIGRQPEVMSVICSRQEKSFFAGVDAEVRQSELSTSGLATFIRTNLSGNLQKALVGWVTGTYEDMGGEADAEKLVNEKAAAGVMLPAVLQDPEACRLIRECFERAKGALEAVKREQKIGNVNEAAPEEDLTEYNLQEDGQQEGSPAAPAPVSRKRTHAPTGYDPTDTFSVSGKVEKDKNGEAGDEDSFFTKLRLVEAYVITIFRSADVTGDGSLDEESFWMTFNTIPLTDFGLSSDEIASAREWSDWKGLEGSIVYMDCAEEIADTLIEAIENPDVGTVRNRSVRDVMTEYTQKFEAEREQKTEENAAPEVNPRDSLQEHASSRTEKCPELVELLHASFNAHSLTEDKEELTMTDFYRVLEMLNLGISSDDIESIVKRADHDKDTMIQWKDALPELDMIIHDMCSDTRDHWVGLMDPESGYGYWYNVRDRNSIWMGEDDNSYFLTNGTAPDYLANDHLVAYSIKRKAIQKGEILDTELRHKQDQAKRHLLERLNRSRGKSHKSPNE
jgi:hypothetical protein